MGWETTKIAFGSFKLLELAQILNFLIMGSK
jgi:hypothetical protein